MFWLYASLLVFIALLFVALPSVWRIRSGQVESQSLRREANIALFHERSNDLESELAEGKLDQQQFDALMRELQKSFLADAEPDAAGNEKERQDKNDGRARAASTSSWSLAVIVACMLSVPVASWVLYERWGAIDDVNLMGFFQQTVENSGGDAEVARQLVVELGQRVQQDEDQPWAWYFLGENFANLGMFEEAEIAYSQSATRMDDSPEKALVLGRAALANYINSGLTITAQTRTIIDEARALNPNEISVLQLLASDAEQNQDYEEAIRFWRLLIQVNPNSAEAQQLRQNIAAAQAILGESEDAGGGSSIILALSLAAGLEIDPQTRVFIAVRNAERDGMPPLAAKFTTVAELPTEIELSDADAVGAFNLSSAKSVYVSALVSFSGAANPQPGDYRAVTASVNLEGSDEVRVSLEIADQIE